MTDMQKLKEKWEVSYKEQLNSIERAVTPTTEDDEEVTAFRKLVSWILETELSGYDFLPEGYKGYKESAYHTNELINMIHHAMLDDGQISFVTMKNNGETRRVFLMFIWSNEESFENMCLQENKYIVDMIEKRQKDKTNMIIEMQKKFPEKNFEIPNENNEGIVFVSHNNALQFIEEVEGFENFRNKRTLELSKKRKALGF